MPHEDDMSSSLRTSLENLQLRTGENRPKRFKIGLDYGTTYSAGVFCLQSGSTLHLTSGKIYPFHAYAKEDNDAKSKDHEQPSDIRYEANGIVKIGGDTLDWPSSNGHCIRRAKLGLDDRPETAPARITLMNDIRRLPSDMTPTQVISDYLTELFGTFKDQLILAGYEPRDFIELNCTVPSIWTHRARRSMITAIEKAADRSGLVFDPVIRLWPEAEAATEHVVHEQPNLNLKKDDVFIVCDAGGGTVDFTTYLVKGTEPLCLKEIVESTGVLCGSTFLDEGFAKYAETRVRACEWLVQNKSEAAIRKHLFLATGKFRSTIKHGFNGRRDRKYHIQFPGLPEDEEHGFGEDELTVHSADLIPIFEEVAAVMWESLRSQLHQAAKIQHHAKLVIFTGGLSESPFMRSYLTKKLAEESQVLGHSNGIQLILTPTVSYSVAAGAIRCSFKVGDDTRTRRISSTSIGVAFSEKYKRKLLRHNVLGVNKTRDEVDKEYYVKNVIRWISTKGKEQRAQTTMELYQRIPAETVDTYAISFQLYACDHACEERYPLSYYHRKSQECYLWEEVTFTLDMSIIKTRLEPKTVKTRKPRRTKKDRQPVAPLRRSLRLSRTSAAVDRDSQRRDGEPVGDEITSSDADITTETAPTRMLTSILEDTGHEDLEKYFHIKYSFVVEFVGLLAKYEFWCEDAQYLKRGTVSLPDYYDFRAETEKV